MIELKEQKPIISLKDINIDEEANPIARFDELEGQITFAVHTRVADTDAATAANYGVFFIAPFPCTLIEAQECHGTLGTNGAAVTLDVEKLTGTTVKGSGVTMLASTFDLKATINTVVAKNLGNSGLSTSQTSGVYDRTLVKGDRVALKTTGTLTAVNDVCVTLTFKTDLANLPI